MSQKEEIERRISDVDKMIRDGEGGSSKGKLIGLTTRTETKRRVRGVLAAARRAVDQFSEPFDKYQLLAKLEQDEEFADKKITASNLRNALRLLTKSGIIRVESEATATKSATYSKAA